ncbi:MATE family efflux transporter [Niabella yanshanensis]|uniref:Multidrug-efflux transporter n=1 Tax=Niabella yanshanensis TaxID=577386 RepID=A0ABZ0WAA8_9BACT|nr:MATE family efflux transporter [Niabella yanshanensis]WQD39432.1 MATE family efflux transporter [Niabella yanshanensis]
MYLSYKTEARNTLKLALPIIFGELAQMSLHLIDTAMIGYTGYKQLAAAALVLNVINIPFIFGIGVTISVAQMVSLAHGKFDKQQVSHYFYNGFWLCAVFGVLISLGLFFGRDILLHLKQDPEVVELAMPFMTLMSFSIIPMVLFMTLKQFADGLQYTKTAMALSIAAIPLNVFLNWLLIYGNWGFPRLELIGAGYATLITRVTIFVLLGIVILNHKVFKKYMAVSKTQWKIKKETLVQLLKIGIPSSLQIGMEAGAFAVSGILVGTIGAAEQAAHQIALSSAAFAFMVSLGLSQAGSIRVSHAFGTTNWKRISVIGKSTVILALIYGAVCCILFAVFKQQLPLLFNHEENVISIAAALLLFAAAFQIPDAIQATSAGLLRGIKDVNVPTFFIFIAYWVLGIPLGYLMAFHFGMAEKGVWIGFISGLSFSAIFLTIRFLKKTRQHLS